MKKIFFGVALFALLLSACAPVSPITPQVDGVSSMVAGTLQALTQAAPAPTASAVPPTQPGGTPVSYKNVSLVLPDGLAGGLSGETVPQVTEQNGAPWEIAPEHIRFTFSGYDNSVGKFSAIEIVVYPMQDLAATTSWMSNSLPKLQAILASPSAPISPKNLPEVPYFNAAQMFAAQIKIVNFQGGSGVRCVTQYGQAVGPVSDNGTFYHFQGLTSDGKYYIVAVLPVGASFLSASNDPAQPLPADGIPFPAMDSTDPAAFEAYFQAVADKLNATDPGAFTPNLSTLDALIQSITVSP